MLVDTNTLLSRAQKEKYALGAFNIYNLEGLTAVIEAAEEMKSPVMVQLHPISIEWNQNRIIPACLAAARDASVPVSIHLDHSQSVKAINTALEKGVTSIMADGSHLDFDENLSFTKSIVEMANQYQACVEGEIGKLAGEEDGLAVEEYEAKLTDPDLAVKYVKETGVKSLAVCIGNVHGKYATTPNLDFPRLKEIRKKISLPLVLHGASGIPKDMLKESISLGICKFNVNTEVRRAYMDSIREILKSNTKPDIMPIIQLSVKNMKDKIKEKIQLFDSEKKAI